MAVFDKIVAVTVCDTLSDDGALVFVWLHVGGGEHADLSTHLSTPPHLIFLGNESHDVTFHQRQLLFPLSFIVIHCYHLEWERDRSADQNCVCDIQGLS